MAVLVPGSLVLAVLVPGFLILAVLVPGFLILAVLTLRSLILVPLVQAVLILVLTGLAILILAILILLFLFGFFLLLTGKILPDVSRIRTPLIFGIHGRRFLCLSYILFRCKSFRDSFSKSVIQMKNYFVILLHRKWHFCGRRCFSKRCRFCGRIFFPVHLKTFFRKFSRITAFFQTFFNISGYLCRKTERAYRIFFIFHACIVQIIIIIL